MIEPTKADIGRAVMCVYPRNEPLRGVVASFDSLVVQVRFEGGHTVWPVARRHLMWLVGDGDPIQVADLTAYDALDEFAAAADAMVNALGPHGECPHCGGVECRCHEDVGL